MTRNNIFTQAVLENTKSISPQSENMKTQSDGF